MYNPGAKKKGDSAKLVTNWWQGPYRIVAKPSDSVVILLNLQTLKTTIPVNVDRLKRYFDRSNFDEDWSRDSSVNQPLTAENESSTNDQNHSVTSPVASPVTSQSRNTNDLQTGSNLSQPSLTPTVPKPRFIEVDRLIKVRKTGSSREYLAKFVDQTIPDRWIKVQDIPPALLHSYHSRYNLAGKLRKSVKVARRNASKK
jgi:hypothetical protein